MQRIASFRTAPTVILVTVALAVGILVAASSVAPRTASTVLFAITATLLLAWTWRLQRTVARALDQVQAAVDSDSATLEGGIAALGDRLATVDYRLSPA
ncbi:MAG: EAL domain-containing protein, partial [Sphingomonas sp.]